MSKNAILKKKTVKQIRKRKNLLKHATEVAIAFATYPPGKPDRHTAQQDVTRYMNRLKVVFGRRASLFIAAVQRHAINAYRQQF
jgi:hypothetical protein